MRKRALNVIATEVKRGPLQPGTLEIFEFSHARAEDRQLVLLAEIEVSDRDNEAIIDALASEIEHQFFNAPAQEPEYAFENALEKANINVKDILLAKPKNWLNRIHVAALAACGAEVHLSSVGMVHAFLVHREKVVDVLASPGHDADTPNPVKLFSNIVSGTLAPDTALVVTNESVLDYLSVERIRSIAHEFSAHEAARKLAELLSRAPEHKQFGIVVLKRLAAASDVPQQDNARVDAYVARTPKTGVDKKETEHGEAVVRFEPSSAAARRIAESIKQLLLSGLTALLAMLAKLLETLQRLLRRSAADAARTVRRAVSSREARAYLTAKLKSTAVSIFYKMNHAPRGRKQLAGAAAVVLMVLFAVSIGLRAREQTIQSQDANRRMQEQTIEQKINEAEAALIYGNKTKSLALLAEAHALLESLANEFPDEVNYAAIRESIIEIRNKGEKKRPVRDIATIATIIPAPLSVNETGLLRLSDALYFYDGIQEKIARLDVAGELALSLALEENMTSFDAALALENNEMAALASDAVLIINARDETVRAQQFAYDPATAAPFASYGGNLYTFDAQENRIVRFRRAGAGFTAAQNWLSGEYELATMRDIAVDGFVYLLDSPGTIHVFLRGVFNKTLPWPASDLPGSFLRLYTTEGGDTLYVLDPSNERIVLITKQGELAVQLTAPVLQKATDLATDEAEENLYVLANDKIYQIPIAQ